jgi:hypothetical protein
MEINKYLFSFINIFWMLINSMTIFLITGIIYYYINIDNYNIRIDYKQIANEKDTNYFNFHMKKIN